MPGDMDAEALQASFDLSFAAIHDIAAGWVDRNATSTSHVSSQKELEEYMKRPARLGVGAPLPELTSLSRETARLRGQLTKNQYNKRVHEHVTQTIDSEDEEESRAGAINKKAKKDPFITRITQVPAAGITERQKAGKNSEKQGKKNNGKNDKPTDGIPPLNLIPDKSKPEASALNIGTEQGIVSPIPLSGTLKVTKSQLDAPTSSVLNLSGPPPVEAEDDNTSPKKKRKRRKKKKAAMPTSES